LRAADALEYRPHLYARHMRTQRSKVFAFISDDIATTPFAGQIIQGAQVTAWRHEMLLLMFNTGGEMEKQLCWNVPRYCALRLISRVLDKGVPARW
jgi:LacI family transcriptional regulator